jgi:hypothetical protein
VAGYHLILVQPDGEPADPGVFITNEPPGLWKVGDEFIALSREDFRASGLYHLLRKLQVSRTGHGAGVHRGF